MGRISWIALWKRIPGRVWRILKSDRVPLRDKLLFIVPVGLYWLFPDLMPFMPIDDALVTAIAAGWFARAMERKHGLGSPDGKSGVAR
ncbi:hypothetical protein ACFPPD_24105 [Cohnella suwonensis]|uniref:DUF1232 domain-containing protein n=1 Tax=Cohnella suwonensis TaxID=696072 RepID=A0ABW0M391_9BACL